MLNNSGVATRETRDSNFEYVTIPSIGPMLGTKCQPHNMNIYIGMTVYGCTRVSCGVVNGVDYVVNDIFKYTITVEVDPQYNLTDENDVDRHKKKLQPFVKSLSTVLREQPKTLQELANLNRTDLR